MEESLSALRSLKTSKATHHSVARVSRGTRCQFSIINFHFSNIRCFLELSSPQNNSKVSLETFWQFEFLSQTDHFAKPIAFELWPVLAIVQNLCVRFKYFLEPFFAHNNSKASLETFFGNFNFSAKLTILQSL